MESASSVSTDVARAAETTEASHEVSPLVAPQGKRASLRRAIASAVSFIPSVTTEAERTAETAEAAQEVAPIVTMDAELTAETPDASHEATSPVTPEQSRAASPRSTTPEMSLIPTVTPDVAPAAATSAAFQETALFVTPEGKRASVRRAISSAMSFIPSVTPDVEPAVETIEAPQETAPPTAEGKHTVPDVEPADETTEASQEASQLVAPEQVSHIASIISDVTPAVETTEAFQEATPLVTPEGKRASLRRAIASAVSFIPSATADVECAVGTAEVAQEVAPHATLDAEPAVEVTPERKRAAASPRSTTPEVSLIPSVTRDVAPAAETTEVSQEPTPLVTPQGKRASLRRAFASAVSLVPAVTPGVERAAEAAETVQDPAPHVTVDAEPADETTEASQEANQVVASEPSSHITSIISDAAYAAETTEASQEATPLVTPQGKRASLRRAIASAVSFAPSVTPDVEPTADTTEASQETSPLVAREGKRASLLRVISSAVPLIKKNVEQDSLADPEVKPEAVEPEVEPEAVEPAAPTASEAFRALADEKLAALAMKQEEWGSTAPLAKAQLLSEIQAALKSALDDLPDVSDSCVRVQGFSDPSDSAADDAWCSEQIANATLVAGFAKKMEVTFRAVAKNGMCPAPKAVRRAPDGREVADVFPLAEDKHHSKKDWRVEVWMQEGKGATQGAALTKRPRSESCGLVLGAGNVGALAVMDSLHLLFQCNTVVLLKMHHLRTYQEPFIRTVLAPLIALGIFDTIVEESGVEDAAYLANHPLLCQLHMTGATETHDAIVWGPRREREGRRQRKEPVLDLGKVTVTSQLGCITPYMICPAIFTEAELQYHAQHLAKAVAANNSYSCNSPNVLLLAEDWGQREAFMNKLRGVFGNVPNPPAYYPGSDQRYAGFASGYTAANFEKIQGPGFEERTECLRLPWTLVHTTADASNLAASADEHAFTSEAFCPVLTVCVLKGTSGPVQFLESATRLCNEHIMGNLSCSLIVHPTVERSCSEDLEKAIANLQYGNVVLNSWSGEAYGMNAGVWGGYAGGLPALEGIDSIHSGNGMVNNCLLFDHPAKAVVRAPFLGTTKVGCGKPSTRASIINLTNFLINPGLVSKAKVLWPRAFCCI